MHAQDVQMTALTTILSLFAIWVLIALFFRDYRIDRFRQQMFNLRNELFDTASSGTISFEHPAYGLLRGTMNGFIRFGHRLDLLNLLMILLFVGPRPRGGIMFEEMWLRCTKTLSESELDVMTNYRLRMSSLVARQVFTSSPLLILALVPPLVILLVVFFLVYRMCSTKWMNKVYTAAMLEGEFQAQAA